MEKQIPEVFQEARYDVFISYSRKDYVDEKTKQPIKDSPVARLIDFLDSHAVSYWIDREGIYVGDKFPGKITEAISESKMLIFMSSVNSNHSKWTAREISLADDRGMHIFPIRIDSSEYGKDIKLYFQGVQYIDYSPSDYIGQFESILLTAINRVKENYEMKLQEEKKRIAREEEERKKDLVRKEITSYKNKYYLHSSRLKEESDSIISKLLSIGEDRKTCPVCGATVPISDTFCGECGWAFVPPFETSEAAVDEKHLSKAQEVWRSAESGARAVEEISSLKEEIARDREQKKKYDEELASANKQMEQDKAQIKSLTEERDALHKDIEAAFFAGHEYVDLGLPSGILWATCNVGALKPSDYGDYFAWGETGPKNSYEWENLKYRIDGDSHKNVRFSKYVTEANYGTVDNRTILEPSDDAARIQWGGAWRMPTHEEWMELREHCDWKWTKQERCNGYTVTSKKNGASIFLPAAGWRDGESRYYEGVLGNYWSSSLFSDYSYDAFYCFFRSDDVNPSHWDGRYFGLSVRPVASSLQ